VRVPGEHGRLLRHLLHEQRLLHQLLLLLLLRRRGRLLHPLLLRMHAGDDRPAPTIRVWSGNQRTPHQRRREKKKRKKRKEKMKMKKRGPLETEWRKEEEKGAGMGEARRGEPRAGDGGYFRGRVTFTVFPLHSSKLGVGPTSA
jgi:hypothetical protein